MDVREAGGVAHGRNTVPGLKKTPSVLSRAQADVSLCVHSYFIRGNNTSNYMSRLNLCREVVAHAFNPST